MPTCYRCLTNKDPVIQIFAEERTQAILNEFVRLVEKYCKRSNEDLYAKDQPLYYKSNQRLNFMLCVYKDLIKRCSLKLSELKNEVERRS